MHTTFDEPCIWPTDICSIRFFWCFCQQKNAVLWSYQLSDEERVIVKKEMKKYELGHIMTEMRSRWCRGHPTSIQSWVWQLLSFFHFRCSIFQKRPMHANRSIVIFVQIQSGIQAIVNRGNRNFSHSKEKIAPVNGIWTKDPIITNHLC